MIFYEVKNIKYLVRNMNIKIYRSTNHEIHYLMSYIGGCMEVMSFIYLYKALIGFMTSNMVFGITSLVKFNFDFESVYHILIIVIWVLISAIHQVIEYKYISKIKKSVACLCYKPYVKLFFDDYIHTSGKLYDCK